MKGKVFALKYENLERQITHDETVTRDKVLIKENGVVTEVEVDEDEDD